MISTGPRTFINCWILMRGSLSSISGSRISRSFLTAVVNLLSGYKIPLIFKPSSIPIIVTKLSGTQRLRKTTPTRLPAFFNSATNSICPRSSSVKTSRFLLPTVRVLLTRVVFGSRISTPGILCPSNIIASEETSGKSAGAWSTATWVSVLLAT